MPTHYEVLGVDPASEQEVIEAAYKALMRKYHPDRAGDNGRVRQITAAYDTIRSPMKRKAYDATLKLFPERALAKREPHLRGSDGDTQRRTRSPSSGGNGQESFKYCPDCGEKVAGAAQVCRYCSFRFDGRWESTLGQRIGCVLVILVMAFVFLLAVESPDQSDLINEVGATEGGACDAGSVELSLRGLAATGTLQLLAPKAETDGYNQLVVGLRSGTCINAAALDELMAATGQKGPVTLLIGYDPNGTLYDFRNRFDYETDGLTPLSELPSPPADMRFGEAIWPQGKSDRLAITWYKDFSAWQRKHYGLSDTQPAPVPTNTQNASFATVGECHFSDIASIGTRLENSPGTGSAVSLANGIFVVSYDTIEAIENSQVGDAVKVCLVSVPTNCPPGDDRGKVYAMLNLRTNESWQLPDSSHMCGGA